MNERRGLTNDILPLACAMHARLQEVEAGGLTIDVPRAMEAILLHDPSYVSRRRSTRPAANPTLRAVEDAARVLRTTVGAVAGELPHTPIYAGPPSSAEIERRRVHAEGGGSATPYTVLVFAPEGDTRAVAVVAELPLAQAFGATEAEALEGVREALDVLLTRAYEQTMRSIDTRGRTFSQAPFHFQPPGAGRTR